MASLEGTSPGSLAEHDIIISISQEAINRQLQLLYNKPIRSTSDKSLPPPPGVKLKSGFVTPASKFLINHDLRICGIDTDWETQKRTFDEESGIFGHIKCPTISLQGESNVGTVEFEFEHVADAQTPNSVYRTWENHKHPVLKDLVINGWKMSWDVKFGEHTFGDFKQDLTKPAADPAQPEVVHPDTLKALNAVSSDHFTVSSIFCMFGDALTVNSFKLVNEKGEIRKSAGDFMNLVTNYFTDLQTSVKPGTATPDHPFVLGYGLAQKVPSLQSIDPNLQTDQTPLYFIPRAYQVTTSPGYTYEGTPAMKQESQYSKGSLNFCITTFRDEKDPPRSVIRVDRSRNPSSGKLAMSPFDLTKTRDHDGLMGFARDLIFDRYLTKKMDDAYFIDPSSLLNSAIVGASIAVDRPQPETTILTANPLEYRRHDQVRYRGHMGATNSDPINANVSSTLTLTWDSELQRNPATIAQKDALRQAYLTAISDIKVDYHYKETGFFKDNNYNTHINVGSKYVFDITSGKGGLINITRDEARTIVPVIKDGKMEVKQGQRGPNDFGAYFTANNDVNEAWETFKGLATLGASSMVGTVISNLQTIISDSITSKVTTQLQSLSSKSFDGLNNKVIMPAGNVFNFAGVDVDSQGNMFTHISFALGAENVTQTPGGKPTELVGKP